MNGSDSMPASGGPLVAGSWGRRALVSGLRNVWLVLIPAFLAILCGRHLVPTPAEAQGPLTSLLARWGSEQPVLLAVGFFLLFAMLARYWSSYLPGKSWLLAPGISPRASAGPQDGHRHASADMRARAGQERRQMAGAIGMAAAAGSMAFVLRGHVVTPCRVLSASMLPTLSPGDLLATDRLAYGAMWFHAKEAAASATPRRGDVIVFRGPDSEATSQPPLIKRVIGLPGDRIAMQGSQPIVNGWKVPYCDAGLYLYVLPDGAVKARLLVEFLEDRAYLTIAAPPPREFAQPYDVKPGEVFVLGDNRNNSSDSRAWNGGRGGGLSIERIEGRARWLLLGTRRDQRADLSRLLEPIGGTRLHLEGVDVAGLREGVAKCLEQWPRDTSVPAPGGDRPSPAVPDRPRLMGE